MSDQLLIAWYGDDFTGSTDVMESLTLHGVPAVLFLESPGPERLKRFPDARAVGVAGTSRSRSPEWMDEHLPATFADLERLGATLCHYKVCSTFDSAPHTGSIGRAIDIGAGVFGTTLTPVVVGAPALRRYQVFGNLFATVDGEHYRIDRHPTMSRHPVTPMDEADLRRHLGRQTDRPMALMDVLALWADDYTERDRALRDASAGVLLYDVIDERTLERVGELIWRAARAGERFCVGSSGVEYALVAHWRRTGAIPADPPRHDDAGEADRVYVMSGSCSPVTGGQIQWARENGYADQPLDPVALANADRREQAIAEAVETACGALADGRSVVAYSAADAPDAAAQGAADDDPEGFTRRLADAQGRILRDVLRRSGVRRAVVAGGDTSGHASAHLGAYALTTRARLAPGAPLCTVHADDTDFQGLEITLKGGQIGPPDFFEQVRRGRA